MKWIFIIFFLLILAVYIVHIMHKRQWRKILGYKPTLDEMAITNFLFKSYPNFQPLFFYIQSY